MNDMPPIIKPRIHRPRSAVPLTVKPGYSIIDAMSDPDVFGRSFVGPSWRPWKVLLKAMHGLPLNAAELQVFRHHTNRKFPPNKLQRESTLVIGRRGGKSRILAALAVFATAFRDYSAHLAPGEVAVAGILASDRDQSRIILNYSRGLLRINDMLESEIEEDQVETLKLRNGNQIQIFTASVSAPRGRSYCLLCADECATWATTSSADILSAVRPGLLTIPDSMLVMASSAYGKSGAFYESFSRHFGREDAKVLVWVGATAEMHSTVNMDIIDEEFAKDPIASEAEYNCVWRNDISSFLSREAVEAVTEARCYERPYLADERYFACCDISGGISDSSTLALGHRDGDTAVVDLILEKFAPHSPEDAIAEMVDILERYHVQSVTGDRYGGELVREHFRKRGIAYQPSENDRSETYLRFLPIVSTKRCRLLDSARLAHQLVSLQRTVGASGKDRVDHMRGQHDDVANAVALLVVALNGTARSMEVWRRLGEDGPVRSPNSKFSFPGFNGLRF